jgi:Na+-driven multidrug efflux pump
VSLERRAIGPALARLAVSTFAATIGDRVLGIADTIVIGTLGTTALAAITGATTVFVVIVLTLHGLSQGAGILAAQAAGAGDGDYDRFGRITRASVLVPLAFGFGVILAAFLACRAGTARAHRSAADGRRGRAVFAATLLVGRSGRGLGDCLHGFRRGGRHAAGI